MLFLPGLKVINKSTNYHESTEVEMVLFCITMILNYLLILTDLKVDGLDFNPEIVIMNGRWEAIQKGFDNKMVFIRWDGKTWLETNNRTIAF